MSLLLTIASGNKRLVTQTFYANATWVAPATTFRIETLSGSGTNGSAGSSYLANTGGSFTGLYNTGSGPGANSGYGTWAQLKSYADAAFNAINSGSSAPYTVCTIIQYITPSITYSVSAGGVVSPGGTPVPGSANYTYSGSAASSGIITGNGNIVINYEIGTGASNGSSSFAFTKNFQGGVGGPATPATYYNEPVTPGNSYNFTIFSGGFVQIQYLQ